MVDNLDNRGQAAGEGVVAVDNDDTANLNEAPVGTLNNCVAHCDGDLTGSGQSRDLESCVMIVQVQLRSRDSGVHTKCRYAVRLVDVTGAYTLKTPETFLMARLSACADRKSSRALTKIRGTTFYRLPCSRHR